MEFKWHFLKKSGIILAFLGFMREFLVALNARFTSIIEKGLLLGGLIKSYGANWPFTGRQIEALVCETCLKAFRSLKVLPYYQYPDICFRLCSDYTG